jgi:hypothetical protein
VNRIKILDFPSQKNNNKPKAPVVPEATIRELTKKLQEA